MNCSRCHHSAESHEGGADTQTGLGRCAIPGCPCRQYSDGIHVIDEDLL